jgi:L-serine dehydratase
VLVAADAPGAVAVIAAVLSAAAVNVATLRLSRRRKGGEAIHVYELDTAPDAATLDNLRALQPVRSLRLVERVS